MILPRENNGMQLVRIEEYMTDFVRLFFDKKSKILYLLVYIEL